MLADKVGRKKKKGLPNPTELVSSVTSAGAATQCWHIASTAGPVDITSCFCVLERSQVLQRERELSGPRGGRGMGRQIIKI
jgi:hypothetical protein